MVHEDITAADLFENIAAGGQARDLLGPGVTVLTKPLESVQTIQFHQECQIQRSVDLKDFLRGYGEFCFQEVKEPGVHAVLHFQADRIASLPLLELFFDLLEQVGGIVLVDREIRIAGDAAQETAMIRADLTAARDDMNLAFDEFQDRIDKIDAALTGAVHKLVAIKHDSGLKPKNADATIESEVERLLSMRAGEVDYSDGKGYAVPVLGPYSTKFISDVAKKVNAGETEGHPASERPAMPHTRPDGGAEDDGEKPPVALKRSYPTVFESNESSIKEANRMLDDADEEAERRSADSGVNNPPPAPQPQPYQGYPNPYQGFPNPYAPQQYVTQPPVRNPIGFGYTDGAEQDERYAQAGMGAPTIDMDSTQLQYLSTPPGMTYDASPVTMEMTQAAPVSAGAEYAQPSAPTFVPNAPIPPDGAPKPSGAAEASPVAKRVAVRKHVKIVSADEREKVSVTLRHGK